MENVNRIQRIQVSLLWGLREIGVEEEGCPLFRSWKCDERNVQYPDEAYSLLRGNLTPLDSHWFCSHSIGWFCSITGSLPNCSLGLPKEDSSMP